MAIPKLYLSTDGNAPVLNGAAGGGTLANLLKKCLVEGYGEKTAAGWTLEFEDTAGTTISLRGNPLTGTGFFLNVIDSGSDYATFRGYESMTGFDAGFLPFPFSGILSMMKSQTADTTSRRWALVATDTIFYLFIYTYAPATGILAESYNNNERGFVDFIGFGDFTKYRDSDGFNCCLIQGYDRYSTTGSTSTNALKFFRAISDGGGAYDSVYVARGIGGDVPVANCELGHVTDGPVFSYLTNSGVSGPYTIGEQYTTGSIIFGSFHFLDTVGYAYRGNMPGLYVPCHDAKCFTQMPLSILTEGEMQFLVVPVFAAYSTSIFTRMAYLVSLGDWA